MGDDKTFKKLKECPYCKNPPSAVAIGTFISIGCCAEMRNSEPFLRMLDILGNAKDHNFDRTLCKLTRDRLVAAWNDCVLSTVTKHLPDFLHV